MEAGMIFGQMETGRSPFQGITKLMNNWLAKYFDRREKEENREILRKGL